MPAANMREYMRRYRAKETQEKRELRLQRQRESWRQDYYERLAKLGLEPVGSGRRRDWNF
jgi:hypothetical protein